MTAVSGFREGEDEFLPEASETGYDAFQEFQAAQAKKIQKRNLIMLLASSMCFKFSMESVTTSFSNTSTSNLPALLRLNLQISPNGPYEISHYNVFI